MADATIGSLRVVLGADSARLEDDLKRAGNSLDKFVRKMGEVAAGIQFQKTVEAVFRAIVDQINKAIDVGDKFSKAAERFGIPGDRLLALAQAAELSEVSLEQLGASLSKLSRTIVEVGSGATNQAASAFKALGISARDSAGNLKTSEQILLEVADAFTRFDNAEVKAALSMAIFKKGGETLVPFLNQGSAGIRKLTEEFRALGLVVDGPALKAAEEFRDAQTRVSQAITIVTLNLLSSSGLLNALKASADATVRMTAAVQDLARAASVLSPIWKVIVTSFELGVFQLKIILTPLLAVVAGLNEFSKSGIALGIGAVIEKFRQLGTIVTELPDKIKNIWKAPDPGVEKLVAEAEAFIAISDRIRLNLKTTFDPEAAKRLETFTKRMESIKMQTLEASGAFTGRLAPGFLETASSMEHLKGQIAGLDGGMLILGKDAQDLNNALFALQGVKLTAEFLDPWTIFQNRLREIVRLQKGEMPISAETAALANQQAAAKMAQAYGEAAAGIVSPMADAFKTLATLNKKYAGIAKALAIAEATINTFVAATKALAQGGVLGFATAAAVTAAGLANVAKISATSFATGGSFTVAGGLSGIDSQLVQFMATPGEIVDVRRPGQESSRATQTVEVRGLRGKDLFTGDMVRNLFDGINAATRDGYRLKFAGGQS